MYLLGRLFHKETDHKPLAPLLSTKNLHALPPRVLRFRLRLTRYDFTIAYTPGKHLYIPGTLSRAPISSSDDSVDLQESVEAFILSVVLTLPATPNRLASLQAAQTQDEILSQIMHYCKVGWRKKNLKGPVKKLLMARNELSVYNDLLLHRNRVVIPTTLKQEILFYTNYMKGTRVSLSATCMQKNQVGGQGYLMTSTLLLSTVIPAVETFQSLQSQ